MSDLISAAWETFGCHCHCGQSFRTDEELKQHKEKKHKTMSDQSLDFKAIRNIPEWRYIERSEYVHPLLDAIEDLQAELKNREATPEITEVEQAAIACRAKLDAVKDSGPDVFTTHYIDGYHKGVSHMVAALADKGGG